VFLRSQDQAGYTVAAKALARGAIDEAGLDASDRALLDYARKLTLSPAEMTDDDTRALHSVGWSDAQVWEATFTISIFAMFNRMADAFGLEAPDNMVAALNR
jgi:uncharacterized peroxidase-related enzyme